MFDVDSKLILDNFTHRLSGMFEMAFFFPDYKNVLQEMQKRIRGKTTTTTQGNHSSYQGIYPSRESVCVCFKQK